MDGSQQQWNPHPSRESAQGNVPPRRRMVRAELLGAHTHRTRCGTAVHIYYRDGAYMGRGRHNRQPFGKTLGRSVPDAEFHLRDLMASIERGSFCRPSEERSRPLKTNAIPRLTLRELCREFLTETRRLRGAKTTADYQSRLAHVLDFAEQPESLRAWPLALDLDRNAILSMRMFLMNRHVRRNGRPGATPKLMSPRHIRNCLEILRSVLAWGLRADVRNLPPEFVNPVTSDVIGPMPAKDPLRKAAIPTTERIRMVRSMDSWQLLHLSLALVLPLRFEDVAGILITDLDLDQRFLQLGTRFEGNDFNKGRVDVRMPLASELVPLLRAVVADRTEGPLFRSRAVWEGRRRVRESVDCRKDLERLFQEALAAAPSGRIQTVQDRKIEFRRLLRRLGGVNADRVSKELKSLLGSLDHLRPYELRGSITQEMRDAGVRHLELRYLTEHTVRDIINEYAGLDPLREMSKYFDIARPLLAAINERADELRIMIPIAENGKEIPGGQDADPVYHEVARTESGDCPEAGSRKMDGA